MALVEVNTLDDSRALCQASDGEIRAEFITPIAIIIANATENILFIKIINRLLTTKILKKNKFYKFAISI